MKLLFTLTFLTLAQSSSVEVDSSVPAVSDQENRNGAVATRVFEEIFNQGRFDVANEIYAPEFRNHGLRRDIGLEEDQNAVHREKQAFPDLKMTIDLLLPKGEFVTVVWTFRGTHTGPGIGLPPTGATIALRGITVWRIVNGRILEEWTFFNELPQYLQVARHVKWFLLAVVGGGLIGVIVLERLLSRLLWFVWRHFLRSRAG